jgi:hypothetical protein
VTLSEGPQTFFFGSVSGSWVAFALFGGIAVFVGMATTAILRRFAARPGELRYYGTTPVARRLVGFIVGSAVFIPIWWWLWSGFYQLDVGRDLVTLRFDVPSRQRLLARADIAGARWDAGQKSTHVLVIETRSGKTYRSTQTSPNDAFERRVSQALIGNDVR